jgi:hypothetical protein
MFSTEQNTEQGPPFCLFCSVGLSWKALTEQRAEQLAEQRASPGADFSALFADVDHTAKLSHFFFLA